ncbi:MAG: vitamin B12 dependent-methionine synthase activation domain-containing protein [Pyramidobacter sp.]|nr:vitamin B12 dependent-methionine synthase activation domain-containing protein [Pyramidobacter sp.]
MTREDVLEALRFMGVPPEGYDASRHIAERGFEELEPLIQPRGCFVRVSVECSGGEVRMADGDLTCVSSSLTRLFAACRSAFVMAVTLGSEVDRRIASLQRTDMARAAALDACASVRADRLCDELQRSAEAELADGEYLTMRFSPGYGDVPLDFSRGILALLDGARRLGISLTKSMMMVPVKSITAVIGISDTPQTAQRSCELCGMKNCMYRKRGGFCGERG